MFSLVQPFLCAYNIVMNRNDKEKINGLIRKAQRDKHILAVFLYGSVAREEEHNQSDIDVCLVLNPARYPPKEISQKKLEYLKLFELDVHVFQQLPVYIRTRVLKEGKILFCRDEGELYELAFVVIREWADFEHIYREYLEEVARG